MIASRDTASTRARGDVHMMAIMALAIVAMVEFAWIALVPPGRETLEVSKADDDIIPDRADWTTAISLPPPVFEDGDVPAVRTGRNDNNRTGPDVRSAWTADVAAGVTADDVPRAADTFELNQDFIRQVRMLAANGADRVLLAHAVVSQYHRQSELTLGTLVKRGANYSEVGPVMDQQRQTLLVAVLGADVSRQWEHDTFLSELGYGGTSLSRDEASALGQLDNQYERNLRDAYRKAVENGTLDTEQTRQQMSVITSEYQNKRIAVLGAHRSASVR